jgi:hypothetical protein
MTPSSIVSLLKYAKKTFASRDPTMTLGSQ